MILVKKSAFEKRLFRDINEIKLGADVISEGLIVGKYNQLTKSPIQALLYENTNSKLTKNIIGTGKTAMVAISGEI